jgi:hypothetical protein
VFPLKIVLVVAALILFALATFGVPSGRFGLVSAGLFCWLLSEHV